jgi:hypothetical protein
MLSYKLIASILAFHVLSSSLAWALAVLPGQTVRSDFDLRGVPILGGNLAPYGFNQYAVDLYFDSGSPWIMGQKIYLEVRSTTDLVLGGLTIGQPFPFNVDNVSGIDISITPLNQSADLVGYLLVTSIDAGFDLLTTSGYFDHDGYAQTNQRIRTGFIATPYNPPNPNFPTWGQPSISEVPLPSSIILHLTGLLMFGCFASWCGFLSSKKFTEEQCPGPPSSSPAGARLRL